jgi:hypothetical protein
MKYAPWVGIDTLKPCECGQMSCMQQCTKQFDMGAARMKAHGLLETLGVTPLINPRPFAEVFDPAEHADATPSPTPHVLRQRLPQPRPVGMQPGRPALPFPQRFPPRGGVRA